MKKKRKVVITGMGVCSSLGFSETEILENFQREKVVFSRSSFDPEVVVSPIQDFELQDFTGRFKDRRYLTRGGEFATAAAMSAIKDAGMAEEMPANAGSFLGVGPNMDMGHELPNIQDGKIREKELKALWMLRFLPNTTASVISKLTGIHGENATLTTACAASLQAIGEGFRKIRDGYLDVALAGGGDSRISPGGILAFKKAGALFTGSNDPETASRPFDVNRNGFVPGEGGAVFVLEEISHAKSRGAKICAEILGYGSSMDGHSMTAPDPEGTYAKEALLRAMDDARVTAEEIDVISAHGTGTLLNDEMEASLIDHMFSNKKPQVTAFKSWIGHTATACGAMELALALVCMRNRFLPRVRYLEKPCHDKVNFIRENGPVSFDHMLLENFGFGGQNAAVIIRRVRPPCNIWAGTGA